MLLLPAGVGYSQKCTEEGSIRNITNSGIGKFEYVVFNFNNTAEAPDFSVETASRPFEDYSGDETINVKGNKFKKIVFRSINWTCQTQNQTRSKTAVKDVKELWTFEGIAEYVVGFRTNSRYITTYHYKADNLTKVVMKFRK